MGRAGRFGGVVAAWVAVVSLVVLAGTAPATAEAPADPTTWEVRDGDGVVGWRDPEGRALFDGARSGQGRATAGFNLMSPTTGMSGTYTLRMVTRGNYTAFADELQAAAAELRHITGANIVVGSPTASEVPAAGVITVQLSSSSPCGPLADYGTIGCGGPEWWWPNPSNQWTAGRVWLFPNAPTSSYGYTTLLHELGHALGLDHWDPTYQGRYMTMNCCSLGEHEGSIRRFLNGDVLGLRTLANRGFLGGGVAVKRVPGAVDRPSLSPGLERVTARWLVPPMYGANVDQYQVQVRNASSGATVTSSAGTSVARTVTGLSGGASYQVRVRAHNAKGWGAWSAWSTTVTTEARCVSGISDVGQSSPFCGDIGWLVGSNISGGYGDGTFRPTATVSRQAMARFLRAFAERLAPGSTAGPHPHAGFTDVPSNHLFAQDIAWLTDSSIASGHPDGSFRPTAPVTRRAMARFLHGFVEHLQPGITGCPPPTVSCTGEPFDDVSSGDAFRGEISWLYQSGISQGTFEGGRWLFKPAEPTNRAAMAAFLHRLEGWYL